MMVDYVLQSEKAIIRGKREDPSIQLITILGNQKGENQYKAMVKASSAPKSAEPVPSRSVAQRGQVDLQW